MVRRSFSIIIPTYGRSAEVAALLDSINLTDYDHSLLEVIVVDQNDAIDLSDTIVRFEKSLDIKHIKVTKKGIAHAKNVGLEKAQHEIVTFADDDSTYYPDTFSVCNQCFEDYPDIDFFYGKVYDRHKKKNVIRNWKRHSLKITKFNYHTNYIAIACFTKEKHLRFDERFGVGTKYGVGEELDYLLQSLDRGYNVWYFPLIEVWHPEVNVFSMTEEKVFYYARGYGAICKKHNSPIMIWNLFASSAYQFIMMVVLFLSTKRSAAKRRYLALAGRIKGYLEYKEEKIC